MRDEWDTKPLIPYADIIKSEATEAFGRMVQRMEHADVSGVPVEFTVTAQFWYDLLKIMEYAILK